MKPVEETDPELASLVMWFCNLSAPKRAWIHFKFRDMFIKFNNCWFLKL